MDKNAKTIQIVEDNMVSVKKVNQIPRKEIVSCVKNVITVTKE